MNRIKLTASNFWCYRRNRNQLWRLLISLVLTGLWSGSISAAGKPSEVIGSAFDFGYVPSGSLLKHTVQIINRSDSLLRVVRTVPGCGCTKIPLPPRAVAPGETLTVEISLDLAKVNAGQFIKAPAILLSDPALGKVSIRLSGFGYRGGDIAAPMRVTPGSVQFQAPGFGRGGGRDSQSWRSGCPGEKCEDSAAVVLFRNYAGSFYCEREQRQNQDQAEFGGQRQ